MSNPSTSNPPAAAAQVPKCLCSIDVHTGTLVFGVVQAAFDVLKLLEFVVLQSSSSGGWMRGVTAATMLLSLAASLGLLYGNRTRRVDFYWPFLIVQGFYVFSVGFVTCLLAVFTVSSALNGLPEGQMMSWPLLLLFWAVLLLVLPLHTYVGCYVVNRSRQQLAAENAKENKGEAPANAPVPTEKA
ncbi:hypothetical protein M3Y99_01040000 [Aphelenchoides fujianensis]|nr:hypothetical protein M3Y99_01040000 [Aphelenchoides fujianensis]